MEINDFYKQFVLKDTVGYFLPGLIVLTGLAFQARPEIIAPLIDQVSLATAVPIIGISYILGHVLNETVSLLDTLGWYRWISKGIGKRYVGPLSQISISDECRYSTPDEVRPYVQRLADLATVQSNAGLALMAFVFLHFAAVDEYDQVPVVGSLSRVYQATSSWSVLLAISLSGLVLFIGARGRWQQWNMYVKSLGRKGAPADARPAADG